MLEKPMDEMNKFVQVVKQKIEERGLSIPEFAERMGVSKQIVYFWFEGRHVMSAKHYLKAKEILQIKDKDLAV